MNNAALILELLLLFARRQQELAALLYKAQGEQRDVTREELDVLFAADDEAKRVLDETIARKQAESGG